MNNRERAESIAQNAEFATRLLAAQRFAEAVECLQTIKERAKDIAEDLHE